MIIRGFDRTSSPANMGVSALAQAPNFTLSTKKFGFECGFYANNEEKTAAQLQAKGNTIFTRGSIGASPANKFATVYNSDSQGFDFSNNTGAYNAGFGFANSYKTIMLDFENQYGDYNNPTNVDRIGNFIKGAVDNGAKVGEFLYGMLIWNDKHVWNGQAAKNQYINPTISGIGTKYVNSLGKTLGELYNLHSKIGYGTIVIQGRQNHDPRAAVYEFIHQFRVFKRQKQAGLLPHVNESLAYVWGPSDTFGAGIPNFWHRINLEAPLNGSIRILNRSEESLKIMKSYAIWSMIEGDGIWYWDAQILSSTTKNDVIDILYSGFPNGEMQYTGNSSLPGSRPTPTRTYPYLDGLSKDIIWQGAHEFSQIESIVTGGTKSEPSYLFKRGSAANFTTVTPVSGGSEIVEAYEQERPIVTKIVNGANLVFVAQDPAAIEGKITKVKVSHNGKSYFLSLNADEPRIYKFTI